MRVLVILSCLIAVHGAALNVTDESETVTINGIQYTKEVLKTDIDRPYFLAVDPTTNTIYFGYTVNDEEFKTAKIDLDSKEYEEIDIENGFSQTVDEIEHVVYFGTNKGIYRYEDKKATVVLPDTDIWQVYFNQILYYSDFPNRYIYTLIDGVSRPYEDLKEMKIYHFSIDKDGDFFYNNSTGLYSQRKGDKHVYTYKELANDEDIRAIATDIHGNAYVCFVDGVYKVDKSKAALEKILDVYDAFGLAFDGDNRIIYSDSTSLVYLKPESEECCVY